MLDDLLLVSYDGTLRLCAFLPPDDALSEYYDGAGLRLILFTKEA